jgi:hypothetical protein
MRKPRVRFREFLLLTTAASLIAAAFAIRARTAHYLSSQDHAFHAYRARLSVNWWEDKIKELKLNLETTPPISEDWATGCGLQLMPSVKDLGDIPTGGKDLIIVADSYGVLYIRIFGSNGQVVVDTAEGMEIGDFQKQLLSLWPPHKLSGIEKRQVIIAVTSILARSKASLQAQLRSIQALHAQAVAKADHHERLAQDAPGQP